MSKARHKKSAGGAASNPPVKDVYAGADSNVVKEAKQRKRGGKVEGKSAKHRLIRRRDGGAVGANTRPLSTAANVSTAPASQGRD